MFKPQQPFSHTKLSSKQRLHAALKALICVGLAVTVLLYGLSFGTNLNTYLNPVNVSLNVVIAVLIYGAVMVMFVVLWLGFNRFMTQAFSGLKKVKAAQDSQQQHSTQKDPGTQG